MPRTKAVKLNIEEHNEITFEIKQGQRCVKFSFKDGVMTGVKQNTPYEKSLEDWRFYVLAIEIMLAQARKRGFHKKAK